MEPKMLSHRKPREVRGRGGSRSGFWFLVSLLNVRHLARLLFSCRSQSQSNRKTYSTLPFPSFVCRRLSGAGRVELGGAAWWSQGSCWQKDRRQQAALAPGSWLTLGSWTGSAALRAVAPGFPDHDPPVPVSSWWAAAAVPRQGQAEGPQHPALC